jgi:hypothetical protein
MKNMQIFILHMDSAMAMPEQQLRNIGSGFQTEELQANTHLSEYTSS